MKRRPAGLHSEHMIWNYKSPDIYYAFKIKGRYHTDGDLRDTAKGLSTSIPASTMISMQTQIFHPAFSPLLGFLAFTPLSTKPQPAP